MSTTREKISAICRGGYICTALVSLLLSAQGQPVPGIDFVPGRILVHPKAALSQAAFDERLRINGLSARRSPHSKLHCISIPAHKVSEVLALLRKDSSVEYAELDGLAKATYVSGDPIVATGQAWHLQKIQAYAAWDFTTDSAGTVVAVLDTGIEPAHPDLQGRILPGYDFVNGDFDPSDDFGHGTAVSGVIIANRDNGTGSAGVASGCSVLPVKVADATGFAAYSTLAEGIRYAVENGARVINISIAGSLPSETLQGAVDYARSHGAIVIAASGNNGSATPMYPAACNGVLSVGATTTNDSIAPFSNYGASLQLTAPGEAIWTTQRDLLRPYAPWRGTSLSAPIVSGIAALAISAQPSLSVAELENLLRQSTDDLQTPGWDPLSGFGRVNAAKVIATLLNIPPPDEPAIQPADATRPLLRIDQGPVHGARVAEEVVTFSGLARDDAGLHKVEAIAGTEVCIAEGTTNWAISIRLQPGTNWISIRALDLAGNSSREARRAIFRVVKTPLTVEISEGGRLVPDLNVAELEIGRAYRVRAVADPGYIFAGWGEKSADSQLLRFIMEPGLTLRPVFVTNPFPAVKGTYAGLIAQEQGVIPETSGYFGLTLLGSGQFTGFLILGGQRSAFLGKFRFDGTAQMVIRRRGLAPLQVQFAMDLAGTSITGTVTDGAWISQAFGYRKVFRASNPAPQAGAREFLMHAPDASTAGAGIGRIATSGTTFVKGRLSSGQFFATRSILNSRGDYPLFVSLKRGTEVVIGWLSFPAQQTSGVAGEVFWVRAGTNSFAAALQVTGAN